jgi:hypothetical protein
MTHFYNYVLTNRKDFIKNEYALYLSSYYNDVYLFINGYIIVISFKSNIYATISDFENEISLFNDYTKDYKKWYDFIINEIINFFI